MGSSALSVTVARLPRGDRALVAGLVAGGLAALTLGLVFGALTALVRAGALDLPAREGYRLLTLHGVAIFFFWIYFVQAALMLVLAAATEGAGRIAWAGSACLGLALIWAGFLAALWGPLQGAVVLYDAPPSVAVDAPRAAGWLYLGYVLLAFGLTLVALAAIATALGPKWNGAIRAWSAVSFAAVAWAGLVLVSAVATLVTFLPALLWSFGLASEPTGHGLAWHILFHNLHYLPLMATVILWYVLIEELTGVRSILGTGFSKAVFTSYLVFVPPTSLYHMFLEPGLSPTVRAVGSILSLFISVPTVLMFLTMTVSLEAHGRAAGEGAFGWLRRLPWRDPAMSAIGYAVVNLALGGAFAFVLIQDRLAPLLSDTFALPGYFHFFTLGTVTLTCLAALTQVVPALVGHRLWRPGLLARLPAVITLGLLIFGFCGVAAGFLGMPRRVMDVTYDGAAPAAWQALSAGLGVGAVLMAVPLAAYCYGLARTLVATSRTVVVPGGAPASFGGLGGGAVAAWSGPLLVSVLVVATALLTIAAFELLESLPIATSGGGGGH